MSNKGFTLIELIIVISIILTISAFAIPGVINYQARQTEEEYINQIINNLRNLQNLSLTRDMYTNFIFSPSDTKFCEGLESEKCQELSFSTTIFSQSSNINNKFYFNEFGDLLSSQTDLITDELVFESSNFKIVLNKYGAIQKVRK